MTNKTGHCYICDTDFDLTGKTEEDAIIDMDNHSDNNHKNALWTPKPSPVDGVDPKTWKGDQTQRDWVIMNESAATNEHNRK